MDGVRQVGQRGLDIDRGGRQQHAAGAELPQAAQGLDLGAEALGPVPAQRGDRAGKGRDA